MLKKLPSTEVKNRFGSVLKEINQTGNPIVVLRDGQPVAVIMTIAEYERSQKEELKPQTKKEILEAVFGLWGDRQEGSDEWLRQSRQEWESRWADE